MVQLVVTIAMRNLTEQPSLCNSLCPQHSPRTMRSGPRDFKGLRRQSGSTAEGHQQSAKQGEIGPIPTYPQDEGTWRARMLDPSRPGDRQKLAGQPTAITLEERRVNSDRLTR